MIAKAREIRQSPVNTFIEGTILKLCAHKGRIHADINQIAIGRMVVQLQEDSQ